MYRWIILDNIKLWITYKIQMIEEYQGWGKGQNAVGIFHITGHCNITIMKILLLKSFRNSICNLKYSRTHYLNLWGILPKYK